MTHEDELAVSRGHEFEHIDLGQWAGRVPEAIKRDHSESRSVRQLSIDEFGSP
jgi:hypothetical protein